MLTSKPSGKPAHQLLFSEAISQQCAMATHQVSTETSTGEPLPCGRQDTTMECILHEITRVDSRLEGMDSKILNLAVESRSIRVDIAGFQDRVVGMEHRLAAVEDRLNVIPDRDQELLHLLNKLINL
ncbi:hypothetical protein NDU88_007855 [Pleurodeles waltl]|uniref:Uncharacterized protein n=1 Tax=Pleurodeles waltl TaxID=8319 RepID=A0AAV7N4V5_PLEWA|nr:hypothetical protein NDU88_007855 [Pleurodeles waltl]